MEDAQNEKKIVEMLQNKEQLAAIGQLIGEDNADLLNNLMSKGTSTHEEDMEKLVDFMSEFQPAIMAIGISHFSYRFLQSSTRLTTLPHVFSMIIF